MSLSKTITCATAGLVGIFAASSAQAVDFRPSVNGRFQQCVSREAFPAALTELHQRGIAKWDAHQGKTKTYYVREMVTAQIERDAASKRWITWTGSDADIQTNGTKPAEFCINTTGVGIMVLNNSVPDKMPARPFGVSYKTPASGDMGNGNYFIDSYVAGSAKSGLYPTVIMNNGNNTFSAIYSTVAGDQVDIAATASNGSTRDTTGASGFAYAPGVAKELANRRSSGQAMTIGIDRQ